MKALLDTLRISLTGLAIGALALGGCSDGGADEHAGHDHGDEMETAGKVVDEHAGHDHGDEAHEAMDAASAVVDEHAGHDHGDAGGDDAERTDVYVGILGELTFVPEAGDTKRPPKIRHAQIPNFKRADGTVAMSPDGIPGMKSMTMEFPIAEGVLFEGFEKGDKVRFSFEVFWGEKFGFEITGIEKIDPGTEIDYSNAKP